MSVEQVTNLTTLPTALVDQFNSSITELLQELNPDIDLKSGVYQDQVLFLQAILQAANQQNIQLVIQSSSLAVIAANPTLADTTTVDNLLSNYSLTPNPGAQATGLVTIVLSQLIGTTIGVGSTFTINGLQFAATTTYTGRTSSQQVIASTDRLITQIGTNMYAFTIPLTAAAVGPSYDVGIGSVVTPDSLPPSFVKAYVQSDFTGGLAATTNAELVAEVAQGLACKTWSNRVTIQGLIQAQAAFANIQGLSIIGFGDPEMIRDQHSIFPGSFGGRSDLYLQSQPLYQNKSVTVTASLISKVGSVGTWQFTLTRDAAPGFYTIEKILLPSVPVTNAGFPPLTDNRGYDTSNYPQAPDIIDYEEAAYSRFQISVVTFVDTVTNATSLSIGTHASYVCLVTQMPLIDGVQDFLSQRTVSPPMCDVLVKAPIPIFTSVSFTLNYVSGTPAPTVAAVQQAVATAVNALTFPGQLSSSFINQALHNAFSNAISVTGLTMVGSLRNVDGTYTNLFSSTQLVVPSSDALMLSGRTASFFLPPASVGVTLVAVDTPSV